MYILYNTLLFFAAPIWLPWMWIRSRARKEAPNWKERRGHYFFQLSPKTPRVWIHAVSVGEVMAALPILEAIKSRHDPPEIVLSVTTSSGHATAREKASEWVDRLVYFPIDLALFQLTAVASVRPRVVAIMETELWFNFLWASKSLEATTMLINGRISDRSFPRSMKLRFFYRSMLAMLDRAMMQTEEDARRIRALGAVNSEVTGNCKYDQGVVAPKKSAEEWRTELGIQESEKVVVVGSTRGIDEDELVLAALASFVQGGVRVVYAPRHLERAPEVIEIGRKHGLPEPALRSKAETGPWMVLDTFGELSEVYQVADLAIIGGGFGNYGGQNLIQPLAVGVPVIHGPHMQNFRDAGEQATRVGASRICATVDELRHTLQLLLKDPATRNKMAEAGKEMVRASMGASKVYADEICRAAQVPFPVRKKGSGK
ncbi:MAG: hypothetical protein JST40_12135 [Armatimonadetes bacterium]|nr:hypothetical protein [Armatimonadota bacterium]